MHTIDRGLKENFFQWKGRLNRKRYLKRMLALWIPGIAMLIYISIAVTGIVLDGNTDVRYLNAEQQAFYENMMQGTILLVLSPFFVSSYMLAIRRLHDVNLPGYFSLLNFIPYVNLGLAVYLLFAEGTTGTNAYGPDPLAPAEKDDIPVQMTKLGAPAEGSAQPAIPHPPADVLLPLCKCLLPRHDEFFLGLLGPRRTHPALAGLYRPADSGHSGDDAPSA